MKDLGRGYVVREVLFEDFFEEMEDLFAAHYKEVEVPRDNVPFDPDYEDYVRRQRGGSLLIFALFHHEVPVGYSMFGVGKSKLHGMPIAIEDITFVHPHHRQGLLGMRFLRAVHDALKEKRMHEISAGFMVTKNLGALYRRLGFTHTAEFYTKVL